MMRIFAIIIGIFLSVTPVQAQQNDIEGVISNQIEALLVDDFVGAFRYAAPNIKQIFQTPERFGQMVRQGYPMVYRPAEVVFQGLRETAGLMEQMVQIRDQQGYYYLARYSLIQVDGMWQISGVSIEKSPGVGV